MKNILILTIPITLATIIFLALPFLGCAPQQMKGEPCSCYTARYLAYKKQKSDIMTSECATALRFQRCLKVMKEHPKMFRSISECMVVK